MSEADHRAPRAGSDSRALRLFPALALLAAFAAGQELAGQEARAPKPVFRTELRSLAARQRPSVVLIESRGRERRSGGLRRDLFRLPEAGAIGTSVEKGVGVIVGPDGIVLTSAAVVPFESPTILVSTARGRFPARLLACDQAADACLVKILDPKGADAEPWPTATPRRSEGPDAAAEGLALVWGDPFGAGRDGRPSVSLGLLSGPVQPAARDIVYTEPVLTVDAAINPGGYGGPVFDAENRLVGIVAPLILSERSDSLLRVVLPVEPILAALRRRLAAPAAWLGVLVTADPGTGAGPDSRPPGLLVTGVQPGSPAEQAGLRAGDHIRSVGQDVVTTPDQLAERLSRESIGAEIVLTVRRDGAVKIFPVTLGRRP